MTNSEKVSEMVRMAREGKNIAQISRELGVDYWEVWSHVERGWQGTKWMVTNRIRRLANENDPAIRKQLANEAEECVNYLYNEGQRLSKKINRIRETLKI